MKITEIQSVREQELSALSVNGFVMDKVQYLGVISKYVVHPYGEELSDLD